MSPNIQSGIRFLAVLGVEWSTLTLIEHGPWWLKVATLILAIAVLGILEFRAALEKKWGRWGFWGSFVCLIAAFGLTCGLAYMMATPDAISVSVALPWLLAAFGSLGIAITIYRAPKHTAQTPVSGRPQIVHQIDGQTHLDLLHLLDFALLQSVFWELDRLLEVAQSPVVTDGIGKGGEDAHASRLWFIGYTRQQLGARTWRQNDFINAMASAEGEAERELENTPPEERPSSIDHLTLRKYRISETQFRRAILFLEHQRRELKEKLGGGRHMLAERSRERSERK